MLGLYAAMAGLGLAAIDPIGIGAMPILLTQKRSYQRVAAFLGGSFVALVVMGLLFAKGLGTPLLHFEQNNYWFTPTVEFVAAVLLLLIATVVYVQQWRGKTAAEPSSKTRRWLDLSDWHLFLVGAALVAVQSLVDIVFVLAMVRVGQFKLSNIALTGGVAVYAIAALVIQLAVVIVFRLSPVKQRARTLRAVQAVLTKHGNKAIIATSLMLSLVFFFLAIQ